MNDPTGVFRPFPPRRPEWPRFIHVTIRSGRRQGTRKTVPVFLRRRWSFVEIVRAS